ncbi:MAG TPA: PAS domain S-box protein [Longimicrobium sp.]|nr:PAS domain S-box protein [Longimicrobium sp.]
MGSRNGGAHGNATGAGRLTPGQLGALLRHVPGFVAVVDEAGTLRHLSPAAEPTLGPREPLAGLPASTLVHPDDRERFGRWLAELRAHPSRLVHERLRLRGADGAFRTVHGSAVNVLDDPEVAWFVVIAQEITTQRADENALAEAGVLFHQFAAAVREVFWVAEADADGALRIVYISPAFEDLWEMPLEVLYADVAGGFAAIHADDRERVRRALDAAFRGVEGREQYRLPLSGGRERWVETRFTPAGTGGHRARRVAGVTEDVTERVVREGELARREEHFRFLVEESRDVFGTLDAAGRLTYVGPCIRIQLGYAPDEVTGRPLADLIDPADRPHLRALLDSLPGRPGGSARGEHHWLRRGGGTCIMDAAFQFSPVSPSGPVLFSARDVTQQRALELQLRQSQKMDAIGRLAGGVAHDFNNLLTAILGHAELILMDLPAESPFREDVVEVKHAAERAAGLTRQLLAFSRQQVMQPAVVAPASVVAGVARLLQRLIGEDVRLVVREEPGAGFVRVDPHQLEQVLLNLAVNARDAMPAGGTLELAVSRVEVGEGAEGWPYFVLPGRYVRLTVRDTGTGMPPEVAQRIFEPFFTTKEAGKGTGLGLATVYGIVQQSEGFVWTSTAPGEGATFTVLLPRVEEDGNAPGDVPAAGEGYAGTVVLLEDERAVRDFAARVLARAGYRVLDFEQPEDALRVLADPAVEVDLLVTDLVMAGMNGPQVAARTRETRPGLPVLYVSGYSREALAERGMGIASGALLAKPFTGAELLEHVAALGPAQRGRAA